MVHQLPRRGEQGGAALKTAAGELAERLAATQPGSELVAVAVVASPAEAAFLVAVVFPAGAASQAEALAAESAGAGSARGMAIAARTSAVKEEFLVAEVEVAAEPAAPRLSHPRARPRHSASDRPAALGG